MLIWPCPLAVVPVASRVTPSGETTSRRTAPLGVNPLPLMLKVVVSCGPVCGLMEMAGALQPAEAVTVCCAVLLCRLVATSMKYSP